MAETQRILVAERIDLIDEHGKVKISLDSKFGVRLIGEDGRPKAGLMLLETGQPALMFFHGPMPRVDLRLTEEGNPDLTLVGNRQLEAAEVLIRAWDKVDAEQPPAAKQQSARRKATKRRA